MWTSWLLAAVLAVHAVIHLMGFAKAFGYADLPQLSQPISTTWGIVWLTAAVLLAASAAAWAGGQRLFWAIGAVALLASQAAVVSSWHDAKAGTLVNLILALIVAHAWLTEGPRSFRAAFEQERATAGAAARATPAGPVVADADLAALPPAVRRYLRLSGVVGAPRVREYRLTFRGRIRGGPDSAWMPFTAEQYSTTSPPRRLFLMRARMFGLPVEAFHRLADGHATMRVTLLGTFPLVDAYGEEMDRSESVTLFNDMCLLAPGTLLDPAIRWLESDAGSARAAFTHGAHTITATLLFDADGRLRDFVSDDRAAAAPDGRSFTRMRFSTPIHTYRTEGHAQRIVRGDGVWHATGGPYAYGEFEVLEATMNPR